MRRWVLMSCALLAALTFSGTASAGDKGKLDMYSATVDSATASGLIARGYDVAETRVNTASGVKIFLVLSPRERAQLAREGLETTPVRDKNGRTSAQRAAAQAVGGFTVWRSYDEPGGIRDELYMLATRYSGFAKLEVIGHSTQNREIIALKVTQGARGMPDGARRAVLYSSTQHAREWISTEVNRRFLRWILEQRRLEDPQIVDLLKTTELWFVLVANPDGYQYTFDVERLWRKTLRDNNGDGQITNGDGVDPNRNYPEHWNYDNEGSSSQFSSDTYRGPSAGSEPETKAIMGLYDRIDFKFHVNYHSFGEWLLYPEGWQIGTASQDDPIYFALSGNKDNPAIPGFQPGLSSDVLYVTNGETTDFAHSVHGALAWTPELGEGEPGAGFVFPDNEALVQAEFVRNRPFALDVARSAADPDDPVSHLGLATKPFYLKSEDTYKTGVATANFAFDVSYGDPQEVRVLAKRSLGAVTLKYQINGGAVVSTTTSEWNGGDRYGGQTDVYYHVVNGTVTGTSPGDTVKVWFEGGGATSDSFTYSAAVESGNRVLVLAAEDYTGASTNPAYPDGPRPFFLSSYAAALAANGIDFDVYDVDANGRKAPDALGVLSHYDAVVWYTGNDVVTRELGWAGGNASRLAMDELLEVRDYLNEGGRLLYTGKFAGHQYTTAHGTQFYDPTAANAQCRADPAVLSRCLALHGSGDSMNDVLQYWLGAYILNDNAGNTSPTCNPATFVGCNVTNVNGVDTPFGSLSWGFNGTDSAGNQNHSASFITTSGILPVSTYPQFESWASAKYDRPGGPFDPHSGDYYVYSQIGDISYKRLTREIAVPAGGATLSFWMSHDTEHDWDFTFVEARTAGGDDWTTLPDVNGNNSQDLGPPTPPGEDDAASCPAGWNELHPHIDHYQTNNGDGTCSPTGTSGEWWAASGNSSGWHQWEVDLTEWAGQTVEVSIGYASDWAVQGLGVFVDDIVVSTDEGSTSFEADADPMDGWSITGPPPGSSPNPNNFIRTTAGGFPEAAVVATDHSLYMGFGFEGISDATTRAAVMGRAMDHLLN
jgi:hypothetical protein